MWQGRHRPRLVVAIVTEAQRRVFEVVAAFLHEHGYAPTVREVTDELGYGSTSTTHFHLKALVTQGYLAGSGRSLRLGWRSGQDAGVG